VESLMFFKVRLGLELPFFLLTGAIAYASFSQPTCGLPESPIS